MNNNSSNSSSESSIESIYEYFNKNGVRGQLCPECKAPISDMPGTRDAICKNCGYKDPCCEWLLNKLISWVHSLEE